MNREISPGSIGHLISARAQTQPEDVALLATDGRSWRYSELARLVAGAEAGLRDAGLEQQRIAVVLPQGPEMALAFLTIAAHATFAPLNPELLRSDFQVALQRSACVALITDTAHCPQACAAAEALGMPVFELALGDCELRFIRASGKAASINGVTAQADEHATALLLHTSGSTAAPKLVPLSQRQLLCSAQSLARSLQLDSGDRCLNLLPLFHVGALVDLILGPLYAGGSAIIGDAMSADALRRGLQLQPTWYQGVPTMLRAALDSLSPSDMNTLRLIRSVSAPLPVDLLHDLEARFNVPVIEIYGMTETAGVICSNPLPPAQRKAGSVGPPVDHDIQIIDDVGNPVGQDAGGEIIVRGDSVIDRYEGDDSSNKRLFFNGWFRTGDLGYLDEDGYLFITGRVKDIINRGGEKISPVEIDRLLSRHAAVAEAGAFAVPHPTLGEDINVGVALNGGAATDEAELLQFLREHLADFKVPRRVHFLDALLKNHTGKLDRRRLREHCLSLDDGTSPTGEELPASDVALLIARMWQRALHLPRIGINDNFFELGGDSLTAAEFIAELQDWLGDPSFFPSLFDAPTIALIEKELQQHRRSDSADLFAREAGLPTAVYREVRQAMASIKGRRRSPESLIIGRNTLGGKQPIFFSTGMKPKLVMQLFGADQPFYLMRSLLDLKCRSPKHTLALAQHYAREIDLIQPRGPLLLGGYCEGGKIAFEAARTLRAQGRDVMLLFTIEQFVPEEYGGATAMYFATRSPFYPYRHTETPEAGWRKYYSGDLSVKIYRWAHLDFLQRHYMGLLLQQVEQDIACIAEQGSLQNNVIPSAPAALSTQQRFTAEDRECEIRVRAPFAVRPGATVTLRAAITNQSGVLWRPYSKSGLCLAARWVNDRGEKSGLRGRQKLLDTLDTGQSQTVALKLNAPTEAGLWELDVDMFEDNVCLFQEVSYRRHTRTIVVGSPREWPGLLLQRLRLAVQKVTGSPENQRRAME